MRILFLTTGTFGDIRQYGLYPDLLRIFMKNGHEVYIVSSREKRAGLPTELVQEDTAKHLMVKVGNVTKTNILEKGISTLLISNQYKRAILRYFSGIKFDLILYFTPPITLASLISYIKKRNNSATYLILKDIFPQNAVDLGMLSKTGIKGILYKYFRKQEKKLYKISDYIGCMSEANVQYVLRHNPEIEKKKVEVCPNSIESHEIKLTQSEKKCMRDKYGIPQDKFVFVYGGNLGKPQGIPFLISCLKSQLTNENTFFLIVGDGTEYDRISAFFEEEKPHNMKLMRRLPKEDYDRMIAACDVGMIFLDHRFTIPNFPSRLLSYMQARLPVLAVTDPNTDVGKVIVEGGFGWWCESNNIQNFIYKINEIIGSNMVQFKKNAYEYLNQNYIVEFNYKTVSGHFK